MEKIFEALASTPRRKILAYLSETKLSAGDIASRFDMTKPSLPKHLKILEAAGLVKADKRGSFVFFSLQKDSLTNTLASCCPTGLPGFHEASQGKQDDCGGKDQAALKRQRIGTKIAQVSTRPAGGHSCTCQGFRRRSGSESAAATQPAKRSTTGFGGSGP